MQVQILPIRDGSDGDGRKWPKHHYERNDEYFLERVASDRWIKDLPGGPQPGVKYRLDRLPQGYAGFQRQRPDAVHIDRYMYGHPKGPFRSLNEFYPHFKHLMDTGGSAGCTCKQCLGLGRGFKQPANSGSDNIQTEAVSKAQPRKPAKVVTSDPAAKRLIAQQRKASPPRPQKRKLADIEGTSDVYEALITQLKDAKGQVIDVSIEERESPDWWTGHSAAIASITSWQKAPPYLPRCGEVVLFSRSPQQGGETIGWEHSAQSFKRLGLSSKVWLGRPNWQAGVVVQLPDEPSDEHDLIDDSTKQQSVSYSGFRIEPLPAPNSENKQWSKQSQYVPLHAIRPFSLLKECMSDLPQSEWHPTIEHARRLASSFCVVGRYRFRGSWPAATVFAMGAYLGSELIMLGDAVRLLPRRHEQRPDAVTDIMLITAIRLRFVNMFLEDDQEHLPIMPYHTCLHFSGRVYTLDPKRSFDGEGKLPTDPTAIEGFPTDLQSYGTWYHFSDPKKPNARIEVPFTRILGRCFDGRAAKAWFSPPDGIAPTTTFLAVNVQRAKPQIPNISRGLAAIMDARSYSHMHDTRIQSQDGRQWFWADTRIEQLDLHEINGKYVGERHEMRTNANIAQWRIALKSMTGKKGEAHRQQQIPNRGRPPKQTGDVRQVTSATGGYGMLASNRDSTSDTHGDSEEEDDSDMRGETAVNEPSIGITTNMQVDEESTMSKATATTAVHDQSHRGGPAEVIIVDSSDDDGEGISKDETRPAPVAAQPSLSLRPSFNAPLASYADSGDSDESVSNQLADELAKSFRPGGEARRRNIS